MKNMTKLKSLSRAFMALISVVSLTMVSGPAAALPCYLTFSQPCPGLGPLGSGMYCDGAEKLSYCDSLTVSMYAQGGWSTGQSNSFQWEGQCLYTCTFHDCFGEPFEHPESRSETMSGAIGANCSRAGGTGAPPT
jgi:hypothetical protein